MRLAIPTIALVLAATSCSKKKETPPAPASSSTAAQPRGPVFDIEGFCEKVMDIGRKCEGDDAIKEGNKVGLCATTLRSARDDQGVKLDQKAADACLADVKKADPPLPDIRTLQMLAQRFESCRTLTKDVPPLRGLKVVPWGSAKEGEPCKTYKDCAGGLYCTSYKDNPKPVCAPKKKAGESCRSSRDCLGRCSLEGGHKCVSYCGSG